MRSLFVVALLASVVAADIAFTSPTAPGRASDFSQNPTYVLGSVQNIVWTSDTDKSLNMVLFQNNRTGDPFEYVFAALANVTSYQWNVATQKSLSDGNVFYFQIYIQGQTSASAQSHYFNLTSSGGSDSSGGSSSKSAPASSSTSSSSSTGSATTNTQASVTSQPTSSGTSTTTPEPASDGGLSTGAKVGMGVGIPIAIGLGILAGWFFFGRKRNQNQNQTSAGETPGSTYAAPHGEHYAPNAMSEQASGAYKPAGTPEAPSTAAPSEIYTPAQQAVELPSGQNSWR